MDESSGGFSPRPTEAPSLRIASTVVGGLLVLESLVMGIAGVFVAIIGGLVSALAFGMSGGSATNAQVTQTFGVIALSLASPFVVASVRPLLRPPPPRDSDGVK